MLNYFEKIEYNLDKIWFQSLGGMYTGRGLLTWDPENGFHIDAFIERKGPNLPSPIPLGKVGYISKEDTNSIRMKSKSFNAIIPYAILNNHIELIWDSRLSFNSSRIIIFNRYKNEKINELSGSVLLKTKGNLILPSNVKTTEKVGNEKEFIGSKNLISHKSEDHSIKGEYYKNNYLSLWYNLSTNKWSRYHCWKWAEAARYALSIITEQDICLLHRKISRGNQTIEEIHKTKDIDSLDIFSSLGFGEPINQDLFVKLTEYFLSEDSMNANNIRVCKNIFNQLIEASRQKTRQGRELLISTILEAALRTIYDIPYKPRKRNINIGQNLEKFCKDYFSEEWTSICTNVEKVFKDMRNRNAHPDWLIKKEGSLSEESLSIALDDIIFLSRFYGYMILALAGLKNFEPRFPPPHKKWKPMATIGTVEENNGG